MAFDKMSNRDIFTARLTAAYEDLFSSDPEYAYSAAHTTPTALAIKMTAGLVTGAANKDGTGIKRVCRELKLPHTYKAIRAFLEG